MDNEQARSAPKSDADMTPDLALLLHEVTLGSVGVEDAESRLADVRAQMQHLSLSPSLSTIQDTLVQVIHFRLGSNLPSIPDDATEDPVKPRNLKQPDELFAETVEGFSVMDKLLQKIRTAEVENDSWQAQGELLSLLANVAESERFYAGAIDLRTASAHIYEKAGLISLASKSFRELAERFEAMNLHEAAARNYVKALTVHSDHQVAIDAQIFAGLLLDSGRCNSLLERYDNAESHYRAAVSVFADIGDEHKLAYSRLLLAETLRQLGRTDEAIEPYEAAIAGYQPNTAADHRRLASSFSGLAECLSKAGHTERSLQAQQQVITTLEKAGEKSAAAAATMRLAAALKSNQDHDQAVVAYRDAGHRFAESDDMVAAGVALFQAGEVLRQLDRDAEAAETFDAATAYLREASNPAPPDIAADINLAFCRCLIDLGRYSEAEHPCQEALRASEISGNAVTQSLATFNLGEIFQDRKDFSAAAVKYRLSLELFNQLETRSIPSIVARAHFNLGVCLTSAEDWAGAEEAFTAALNIQNSAGHATPAAFSRIRLANVLANAGKLEDGEQLLVEARRTFIATNNHRLSATAGLLLARNQFQQGNYAAAEATCTDILARTEQHKDVAEVRDTAYELLGRMLRNQKRYADAVDHYKARASFHAQAGDAKETATNTYWLAHSLRLNQNLTEAEVTYRSLLTHHADALDKVTVANTHLELAHTLRRREVYPGAEAEYRVATMHFSAINDLGSAGLATFGLAESLKLQAQFGEAAHFYKSVLDEYQSSLDPSTTASARWELAHVLRQQGRLVESKQQYQECIRVFSELNQPNAVAEATYYTAICLREQDRQGEAEQMFLAAIGRYEECCNTAQAAFVRYWLSNMYLGQERYDAAILGYRQALADYNTKTDPHLVANTYFEIARCLRHQDDHENAAKYYESAARRYRNDADTALATFWHAHSLRSLKLYEAAEVQYRVAADLDVGTDTVGAEATYYLADVIRSQGRHKEAADKYQAARVLYAAIDNKSQEANATFYFAQCLRHQEDHENAAKYYESAAREYRQLGNDADTALATLWHAHSLRSLKLYEAAEVQYRVAADLYVGTDTVGAEATYYLADVIGSQGRHKEAADKYQAARVLYAAIDNKSGRASATFGLASALWRQGLYKDSESQYQAAADMYSDLANRTMFPQAVHWRGRAQLRGGRAAEALESFGEAIAYLEHNDDLDSTYFGDSLHCQGDTLASLGEYEPALDSYTRAAAAHNSSGNAADALESFGAAISLYQALGRTQEALHLVDETLDLLAQLGRETDAAYLLSDTVASLNRDGQHGEARRLWQRVGWPATPKESAQRRITRLLIEAYLDTSSSGPNLYTLDTSTVDDSHWTTTDDLYYLISAMQVAALTGRFNAAKSIFSKILTMPTTSLSHISFAELYCQAAWACHRTDAWHEGIAYAKKALEITAPLRKRAGALRTSARAHMVLAGIYSEISMDDLAYQSANAADADLRVAGDARAAAVNAIAYAGNLLSLTGVTKTGLEFALRIARRSLKLFEANQEHHVVVHCMLLIASCHDGLEDPIQAVRTCDEALAYVRENASVKAFEPLLLWVQAMAAYKCDDVPRSLELARDASRLAITKDQYEVAATAQLHIAALEADLGNLQRADEATQQAIENYRKVSLPQEIAWAKISAAEYHFEANLSNPLIDTNNRRALLRTLIPPLLYLDTIRFEFIEADQRRQWTSKYTSAIGLAFKIANAINDTQTMADLIEQRINSVVHRATAEPEVKTTILPTKLTTTEPPTRRQGPALAAGGATRLLATSNLPAAPPPRLLRTLSSGEPVVVLEEFLFDPDSGGPTTIDAVRIW